jgi:hypothetical protein
MTVNKAEVGEGTKRIELVLLAEHEAGAPQEDRGDLFFTTSVENRESPLYRALTTPERVRGKPVFSEVRSKGRATPGSPTLLAEGW